MKLAALASVFACLIGVVPAQAAVERLWTGINGKSFRGTLHKLSPDRKKAEILSADGKLLSVALDNLIPADRDWIFNPTTPAPADPAAPGDLSLFKPVASPSRLLTPSLDPKTFGCSTDHSLVDALWISLLWWDQTQVLEVPKKGDLEVKAEWLHKKLTRAVVVGGDNVSADDAKKGVEEYFSKELENVAACRITIEQKDFTAARLAGCLQGANAVVMRMSMQYANGRDYAVSSVLESMSEDGKFVFHAFGRRFTGHLKPLEKEKQMAGDEVVTEYVLDRPGDLPDYYATNEARFFMGMKTWNATLVLKPYVYLTPGKAVPLPAEEERPVPAGKNTKTVETKAPEAKFPVSFTSTVHGRREWVLMDGTRILGTPVARLGQMVTLRNADGQQVTVDEIELSEDDRARFCFWEAGSGMPRSMSKLDLTYQLNTPVNGNFEVNVSSDGSLGRVCITDEYGPKILVYDMSDGAFVCTYVHRGKAKENTRIHIGRFLPRSLLPHGPAGWFTQADLNRTISEILPRSPELVSAVVPCRRVRFPLAEGATTFLKPDIDFVLCEQSTVIAGLYQLLFGPSSGGEGEVSIFSPVQIPSNPHGIKVLATLAACRVLPVRIAWENPLDATITAEYHRVRNAGKFSIELTHARIPSAFPEGHFAIPKAARAMVAGSTKTTETEKPR